REDGKPRLEITLGELFPGAQPLSAASRRKGGRANKPISFGIGAEPGHHIDLGARARKHCAADASSEIEKSLIICLILWQHGCCSVDRMPSIRLSHAPPRAAA